MCIEVTTETTQATAYRLTIEENVDNPILLNFASARNPGGGFINGAKAQEEDLSGCSGLYPCQLKQLVYYKRNRENKSLLYTDHMIYSPRVPWFRVHNRELLNEIFFASVIIAPAPNAGQYIRQKQGGWQKIEVTLRRRAGYILSVARDRGQRCVILSAWGCGVFQNKPDMVADAFDVWLNDSRFYGAFDRIIFGIYDRTKTKEQNLKQHLLDAYARKDADDIEDLVYVMCKVDLFSTEFVSIICMLPVGLHN